MRVGYLLLGDSPFLNTGYANQLRLVAKCLLKEGRQVAFAAAYGFAEAKGEIELEYVSDMCWATVKVYPHDKFPGNLTQATLQKHIEDFRRTKALDEVIVLGLGNTWNYAKVLSQHPYSALWAPVDGHGIEAPALQAYNGIWKTIAMSKFGANQMNEFGILPNEIFPHMVEVEPCSKSFARQKLGLPHDHFIVGYFGDGSPRKCPRENIYAFGAFCRSNPSVKALLYVKTKLNHPQGMELKSIIKEAQANFGEFNVKFVDDHDNLLGLSNKSMGEALSAMDVMLHASQQEGFGIFQIEAQACGVPVISTNFGPMPELNSDLNLCVPSNRDVVNPGGVIVKAPDWEQIVLRLNGLYQEASRDGVAIADRQQECKRFANKYSVSEIWPDVWRTFQEWEEEVAFEQTPVMLEPTDCEHVVLVSTYDVKCGIATYTRMLAEQISGPKTKVSILAESESPFELSIDKIHTHDDETIDVYRCWHRRNPDATAILEVIEEIKPDVLHIQHEWQLFPSTNPVLPNLGMMTCRKVMTIHTPDPPGLERLHAQVSLFVDVFITHWRETSQNIPLYCPYGFPHSAIQTIKHGIRDPKTHPRDDAHYLAKQEIGIPTKVPLFFTFGFTSTAKGTKELLQAAAAASSDDECPHFELIVSAAAHPEWAHDTAIQSYLAECKNIADQYDNIHLIGYLEEDEIDKYANASDYLIFPYRLPMQVNSASGAARRVLGYCKPVIVTDEGRLRDLAGGVHGWKVGQYDTNAMVQAIKSAASMNLHGKHYNDFSRALERLRYEDSWESAGFQHLILYERLCQLHSTFWRRPYNIGKLRWNKPWGQCPEFLSFFEDDLPGRPHYRFEEPAVEMKEAQEIESYKVIINGEEVFNSGGEEE